MFVQNISETPLQNDPIYGTGVWEHGETREVNAELGTKLLRHKDVWRRVESLDATADPLPKEPSDLDLEEISAMTLVKMKPVLDDLSDDDLIAVFELEQNRDQPRTTVMTHLSGLIEARVDG